MKFEPLSIGRVKAHWTHTAELVEWLTRSIAVSEAYFQRSYLQLELSHVNGATIKGCPVYQ